jgi:hypothetical protein
MTNDPALDRAEYGTPWYQNFWPWFIVVLLGISVIGSLVTVAIAYHHRDIDVRSLIPDAATSQTGPPARTG